MAPKKRTRTGSAPPAPTTPERSAATPKHAKTEGRPSGKPSPSPTAAAAASGPAGSPLPRPGKTPKEHGKSSSGHSEERSKSLVISASKSRDGATGSESGPTPRKRVVRPLKLLDAVDDVPAADKGEHPDSSTIATTTTTTTAAADSATFTPTNTVRDLESVVLRSKVIAPDVSGIACVAASRDESEVVLARENGSLVLYRVEVFQNISHFTQVRATGGRVHRTITRVAFLDLSACVGSGAAPTAWNPHRYFIASYLSGQLVIYDSETLFPVSVHQRTGGAVWDMTVVEGSCVYAALADGSWHRLRVVLARTGSQPQQRPRPTLELECVIPRITGADRALSVAASARLRLVVGTDDAGNVHAWRHATTTVADGAAGGSAAATLSAHETLWTCRLPKGIALSCAVAEGGAVPHPGSSGAAAAHTRPAVAVGTSMGDVVILDAQHGRVLHTFSTHKGPVSTVVCHDGVFYGSGWHESLRSFRCAVGGGGGAAADGEWYPAEVKRRTHYHEATQLLVLGQRQLLLSASRDGTMLYSPVSQLFSSPAMYVQVSTQRFAFAQEKNVLLQTRLGRIEAFRMDAALRHWTPLFAHNIHGKFHLSGMWCDPQLHYIVFSTDERVVVSRVVWREGAEAALAIARIEEVRELPVGRGLLDAAFVPSAGAGATGTAEAAEGAFDREAALYLLFDDHVLYVTLTEGYPVIRTELACASGWVGDGLRPTRLMHVRAPLPSTSTPAAASSLVIYGLRGTWSCGLTADGTPDPDSARCTLGPAATCTHVQAVPALCCGSSAPAATPTPAPAAVLVGLCAADGRFVRGLAPTSTTGSTPLPKTLPHDVTFVAALPRATRAGAAGERPLAENLLGYFSKGLVFVGAREWRMAARASVEAAFVMQDRRHVLILERNLERTLEALPLCWKVRRFGN